MKQFLRWRWRRLQRWYEQARCRHDWMNTVCVYTLLTKDRTCRKCLKNQQAVIRWR